jgi:hypothetical protein
MPEGWAPPSGWTPDPNWPAAPPGWIFWESAPSPVVTQEPAPIATPQPEPEPAPAPGPSTAADRKADKPDPSAVDTAAELAALRANLAAARDELERMRVATAIDVIELDDQRVLQEIGIYQYRHPLQDAAAFKDRLKELQDRIKETVKTREAILVSESFTLDNSLAKGRRMTSDLGKLMLRAYNAEADNCVRSLRAGNLVTAMKRLNATAEAIARLGLLMQMSISPEYHALRVEELELTSDYLMKKQEEREAARLEREHLREERKAQEELAADRARLEKEREHYLNEIESLRDRGANAAADEMLERLEQIDSAIDENDHRIANIRAGYVYVISNEGAFGRGVVKIGLTRRLDPLDRVRELGGASVPFRFDVHAIHFADDAVTLESELHAAFAERRVNVVNERREFFFVTPEEVRDLLMAKAGNLLEFTEAADAPEFVQSFNSWPARERERRVSTDE